MKRTPEDFLSDMMRLKRDPLAILAVARVIRGGEWFEQVKQTLSERGLIKEAELQAARDRISALLKKKWAIQQKSEVRNMELEREKRKKNKST